MAVQSSKKASTNRSQPFEEEKNLQNRPITPPNVHILSVFCQLKAGEEEHPWKLCVHWSESQHVHPFKDTVGEERAQGCSRGAAALWESTVPKWAEKTLRYLSLPGSVLIPPHSFHFIQDSSSISNKWPISCIQETWGITGMPASLPQGLLGGF